jgi:hypothetical protein
MNRDTSAVMLQNTSVKQVTLQDCLSSIKQMKTSQTAFEHQQIGPLR